jgi:hypothetical protein
VDTIWAPSTSRYHRHVPKKPSPDHLLAYENYARLNETFYAAEPADYFDQRLHNLILVAGNSAGLDRLLEEGVTFRSMTVGGGPPRVTDPADQANERDKAAKSAEHFVIAEAEVLSQHAGETLLRLYLAHEARPLCPWLDVSRLRSPAAFKELVRRRFGVDSDPSDPAHLAAVARVFHLTDDWASLSPVPPPQSEWNRSVENIEGYLRHFARQFLNRAGLYHAAKHGLALRPTEMSMKLDDGSVLSADGPVMQYLQIRDDDGQPRWSEVTHWVRSDMQMALVFRACQLIETLWEVARIRYLPGQRGGTFQLRLFSGATVDELVRSGLGSEGSGIVLDDVSMDLLYYRPVTDTESDSAAKTP